MSKLFGTEAQITKAEQIRAKAVVLIDSHVEKTYGTNLNTHDANIISRAKSDYFRNKSAAYIIMRGSEQNIIKDFTMHVLLAEEM